MRLFLILGLAGMLAGCVKPDPYTMTDAWVRLAAVPDRPAAGYFTFHGGSTPVRIVAANSNLSLRAEMHRSMTGGGGMAGMAPLRAIDVPAGQDVVFAPGGRHVMLFDMNPTIKPGGRVTLTVTLANGRRIGARAIVVAAGAPAPEF